MKNMTLKNITAACHGTFHGDSSFLEKEITGVAIDSRKAAPGFLFVPLIGARVDGQHLYPTGYGNRVHLLLLQKKILLPLPVPVFM